ncbi:MAG: hypothetical protein AAF968_00705 [Pseudomonadota bacterium]
MTAPRDMLDDVFRVVDAVILRGIGADAFAESLIWRRRDADSFDAGVLPVGPSRSRISINDGVADALFSIVGAVGNAPSSLEQTHLREASAVLGDENVALNLSLLSGTVFVALHEACHAAAGHVDYLRRNYRNATGLRLNMSEVGPRDRVDALPGAMAYTTFRKLSELEADGAAFALTLAFAPELARVLTTTADVQPDPERACERAVLLGALAAVVQLETAATADDIYPDPRLRLLNVIASGFRSFAPAAIQRRDDDYVARPLAEADAQVLTERYEKTMMPALFMLDGAVGRLGRPSPLLVTGASDPRSMLSDLMQDALVILGGGEPSRTEAGRSLMHLSRGRATFMAAMQDSRRTDLWRAE